MEWDIYQSVRELPPEIKEVFIREAENLVNHLTYGNSFEVAKWLDETDLFCGLEKEYSIESLKRIIKCEDRQDEYDCVFREAILNKIIADKIYGKL